MGIEKMTSTFNPPKFAGGHETPEYKSVLKEDKLNIEIREYKESFWVTTDMKNDKTVKENNSAGFWKLFNYIQGQNEKEEKISMTSPVVKKIIPKTPFTSNDKIGT